MEKQKSLNDSGPATGIMKLRKRNHSDSVLPKDKAASAKNKDTVKRETIKIRRYKQNVKNDPDRFEEFKKKKKFDG
jgi:hypothetical protein